MGRLLIATLQWNSATRARSDDLVLRRHRCALWPSSSTTAGMAGRSHASRRLRFALVSSSKGSCAGLGHAGFDQTQAGASLCDPWASWFPFPDNSGRALWVADYHSMSHAPIRSALSTRLFSKDMLLPALFTRPAMSCKKLRIVIVLHSVKHRRDPGGERDDRHRRGPPTVRSARRWRRRQQLSTPVDPGRAGIGFGASTCICCSAGAIWYPMWSDMPARARRMRSNGRWTCSTPVHRCGVQWIGAASCCLAAPQRRR